MSERHRANLSSDEYKDGSNGTEDDWKKRYWRMSLYDKRIAKGDDYAGDCWYDSQIGEAIYVAVGHDPNETRK